MEQTEIVDSNVHYLCDSCVEIDGLKFYGVPMFMEDCITERQTRNYAIYRLILMC